MTGWTPWLAVILFSLCITLFAVFVEKAIKRGWWK